MSARAERGGWGEPPPERVEQRIVIERDNTVTARSGKVEYGQGIRAGFAMIVAEELGVRFDRVRVELGETDRVPWDMGTFGSMSTAVDGSLLRAAAAVARAMLLERAAARWQLPMDGLDTRDGAVVASDGRTLSFAALTAGEPLAGPVASAVLRPMTEAVDQPRRTGAFDIVTGRARYPGDIRLPGMVHGHALAPPRSGCGLLALVDRGAAAVSGVIAVVRDGDFVGVVAERDEQAHEALRLLHVDWGPPPPPAAPTQIEMRNDGGVDEAFAGGHGIIAAEYSVPHIAHASIGPSAAVASVTRDRTDVYAATQRPFGLRDEVAGLLATPPQRVSIHPTAMGGMYGRGNMNDAALEAVRLSRAVQRPVMVQWTRTEEFQRSPARPVLEAHLEAVLTDGTITAWRSSIRTNPHAYVGAVVPPQVLEITSGRNAVPAYRLGRAAVMLEVVPASIRTGAFRSLAAAPNIFAIESFIDELAGAAGRDPIAFRLEHLDDPRLRRVLETVRERSGWDRHGQVAGRGLGVACAIYNDTAVAQVAEVVCTDGATVRLERIWCAVDAGHLVHPDGARNQIEGGIQQAASWTLLEALAVDDGAIATTNWRDYPIATFRDAPERIDVVFTTTPGQRSSGTGEPGSVPTAAAIANAVFAACGVRVRRLPFARGVNDARSP
jgi:CO/xanthine dehydrogenase Mo-binding subunit